jgi:hypothetical protein
MSIQHIITMIPHHPERNSQGVKPVVGDIIIKNDEVPLFTIKPSNPSNPNEDKFIITGPRNETEITREHIIYYYHPIDKYDCDFNKNNTMTNTDLHKYLIKNPERLFINKIRNDYFLITSINNDNYTIRGKWDKAEAEAEAEAENETILGRGVLNECLLIKQTNPRGEGIKKKKSKKKKSKKKKSKKKKSIKRKKRKSQKK